MPARLVEEGPWAGWKAWHARPEGRFVDGLGDIFTRDEPWSDSTPGILACIETGRQHSNGLGFLHGGFLMAFVDVVMFATIRHMLETQAALTVQASTDFLGAAMVGSVLEGRGRIVKETGRLVWVAGTLTQDGGDRLVAQWHGLLRKVPRTRA
jgi:acyl-coenzyme A thioesterase PaaI-like protein